MKAKRVVSAVLALGLLLGAVAGLTQAQEPGPEGRVGSPAAANSEFELVAGQEDGSVSPENLVSPSSSRGIEASPTGLISYQGRLLLDAVPYNGSIDITFRLYDDPTGGWLLWEETQAVQVDNGLFDVMLGAVSPLDDLAVYFSNQQWLSVQPAGAASELTPRQPLGAVGYAMNLMPGATLLDHNAGGVYGYSFYVAADNHPAIYGRSYSSAGITGEGTTVGVEGSSDNGTGVRGLSTNNWGGYLRGVDVFSGPDVVLGGVAGLTTDDGVVWSEPGVDGSDLAFFTNDEFFIHLDEDNNEISEFSVINGENFNACRIQEDGDLICAGTKSAAVNTTLGPRRLFAIESPENWFEDFGGGQLVDGQATVAIEPLFLETVNTGVDYRVFLTPLGDCRGLYVASKTPTSFEVRELGGGEANIAFDYRIVAKRLGYESLRLDSPDPEQLDDTLAVRGWPSAGAEPSSIDAPGE